ncbi:hypothetical protein C486_01489 [Natrinema gari JCM 14663]|uniref:Uncharacterized protein n=1 Tax=Natrinema gari JCM 14663 TaxID=1230459 RepID=L9ZCX4_9EURY|nr:hypothetical protein C486_01489 [Natrinema gari JCM 14663]
MVPGTKKDRGMDSDPDRADHYTTTRLAVGDGALDVVGTISLLGFSLLFLFIGVRGILIESSTALSSLFVIAACLVAAAACNLVPPFRN